MRAWTTMAAALLVAGCADDLGALPSDERATNTGTFPSFRDAPLAATDQFSDAEVAVSIAQLRSSAAVAAREAGMPMTDLFRLAMIGDEAAMRAMGMSEVQRLNEIMRLAEAGNRAATQALGGPNEVDYLRRLRDTHEQRTLERIRSGDA